MSSIVALLLLMCWLPFIKLEYCWATRVLCYLLEMNGAFFIKFAQLYTSIYGGPLTGRVYNDIYEHKWDVTSAAYYKGFGKKIDDQYVMNNGGRPIASGSIGQVYDASDVATGERVAIKVRHPNVILSQTQMSLIKYTLKSMLYISGVTLIDVDEFLKTYSDQLDMRHEVANMQRFAENMKRVPFVNIPTPVKWTDNIIVMTYHEGQGINELEGEPYVAKKVALMLYVTIRAMILEHGFLHCDLHKGNWSYNVDQKCINIYDTGFAINIDKELIKELFQQMNNGNIEAALCLFMKKMLVKRLEQCVIKKWINNHPQLVSRLTVNCQARNILKAFSRCADDNKTAIKTDMLHLLISNMSIERHLSQNDMVSQSQHKTLDIMKSEMSICKQYDVFHGYHAFLQSCINDVVVEERIDTDIVAEFYKST